MGEMTQIIIAPGRYVQGRGAINELGEHTSIFGNNVLVVGGKTGLASTSQGREQSFAKHGISQVEELFQGECSDAEIERLSEIARTQKCDVVMASGVGKLQYGRNLGGVPGVHQHLGTMPEF